MTWLHLSVRFQKCCPTGILCSIDLSNWRVPTILSGDFGPSVLKRSWILSSTISQLLVSSSYRMLVFDDPKKNTFRLNVNWGNIKNLSSTFVLLHNPRIVKVGVFFQAQMKHNLSEQEASLYFWWVSFNAKIYTTISALFELLNPCP